MKGTETQTQVGRTNQNGRHGGVPLVKGTETATGLGSVSDIWIAIIVSRGPRDACYCNARSAPNRAMGTIRMSGWGLYGWSAVPRRTWA